MSSLVFKFKTGRFVWTFLITIYFLIFFTNFLTDALPERSLIPLILACSFVIWLAVEYYFGSPFFQSGVVQPSPLWRGVFAFFVYPYFGYLGADFIWLGWTQIPINHLIPGIFGLLLFWLGVYLRLSTLFSFLKIIQIKSGSGEPLAPIKRLLKLKTQKICRHPRYLGTLIQLIGAAFAFSSWGGLVLTLILGLPLILLQLRYEENQLCQLAGQEWDSYRQSVPLLFPRCRRQFRQQ